MNWLRKFKFSLPPLPTPPPVHAPERSTLLMLCALVLVAVISHFSIASPVIAGLAFAIWLLKTALIAGKKHNPPKLLIMLLTILSVLLILLFYGGWNGQRAGISFLVLLLSLKFLESATLRDYFVVCLILLLVAATSFLFNGSLRNILIVTSYVLCVISVVLKIANPSHINFTDALATSGGILLKALPLAILLFFFFPRIQGDFGFIPSQDELSSTEELSDTLDASDFASAAFNNELAFRVEFDGDIPRTNELYWRAKVMTRELNFTWAIDEPSIQDIRRAKLRSNQAWQDEIPPNNLVSYSIIHENSTDDFLPYLDYVVQPSKGLQLDNYAVFNNKREEGVFAYRGISAKSPNLKQSTPAGMDALLATTSVPQRRTLALLSRWRREHSNQTQLVNAAYSLFKQDEFRYTLEPPNLGDYPVDEFLFDSRRGYCAHYASAFTIMMRWLGIPARIVVGYQGGKVNNAGKFLEVKYHDAHAWSEVWLNERWVRVDPTSAVSEERTEHGMEALLEMWRNNELGDNAAGRALADFLNPSGYQRAMRKARETWDNIGYQWNKWIINYDFDTQRRLLAQIGLDTGNTAYTLIGILSGGVMLLMLLYFWQLIPKAIMLGEAEQIYLSFLHRFKRYKMIKTASETPSEFGERASHAFPVQANQIIKITDTYSQIRYGRNTVDLEKFKQSVKQFKLRAAVKHNPDQLPSQDGSVKLDRLKKTEHPGKISNIKMKKLTDNIYVAGQISTNDFVQLAQAGIKTIINNRPDGEEAGQLDFTTASKLAAEHGMNYHYLPMAGGQPLPPSLVDDFKAVIDTSEGPYLAHCRSGFRSSFLWSLGQIAAGKITPDQAIAAAVGAGIPLEQARAALEAAVPTD